MKYTLILWIAGCIGEACPIPYYELHDFSDLATCEEYLLEQQERYKRYAGICMQGDVPQLRSGEHYVR